MNHYVPAGQIFFKEKNTFLAYNLFLDALAQEEYNPEIWFLVGYSLGAHYIVCKDEYFIRNSWASYKRSLQLNPNHILSKKVLKNFDDTVSGHEILKRIPIAQFEFVMELKAEVTPEQILEGYNAITNEDDKIAIPMHLGETKNPLFFELLRHCILEETNRHVHYAALKRIHFYKDTHDLQPIFKVIVERGVKEYEPYFSMALSSIDAKWSKELLKQHSKADFFSEEKASNINNESNGDADDMIKSIFAISLSKYKPEELNQLYHQRNSKILGFYLINQLNDEGIRIILTNKVLDKTGFLTEKGWNYMKEFLESYSPDTAANHPNDTDTKKAWWKLW